MLGKGDAVYGTARLGGRVAFFAGCGSLAFRHLVLEARCNGGILGGVYCVWSWVSIPLQPGD
jgi:hypothetical protein